VVYAEALVLTAPLDRAGMEEAPDLKGYLAAVRLALRDWRHKRAGDLLSEPTQQSYAVLCGRLDVATGHPGPPTPAELEAVWRAKIDFRKGLRADELGKPVAELHSFPVMALPGPARTGGWHWAGRPGKRERAGGTMGKAEARDDWGVRHQPVSQARRWASSGPRRSPGGWR
jgi:hypothetical protein